MDQIHVENLVCKGKHGYYKDERKVEQEFLIDISIVFDTKSAGKTDDLKETLDYDRVKETAEETVSNTTRYLIETIAEEIAEKILKFNGVIEVKVSVRKTAVWDNGVPGVTISRKRQ